MIIINSKNIINKYNESPIDGNASSRTNLQSTQVLSLIIPSHY